jgi:hypothetical protein
VHVVTAEHTAAACPSCGVFSTSMEGNVTAWPKDLPYGSGRVIVVGNTPYDVAGAQANGVAPWALRPGAAHRCLRAASADAVRWERFSGHRWFNLQQAHQRGSAGTPAVSCTAKMNSRYVAPGLARCKQAAVD